MPPTTRARWSTPTSIRGRSRGRAHGPGLRPSPRTSPLRTAVPQAKFGTLGLMRADQIPDIHAIYVEKEELLPFAYGAKASARSPPSPPPGRSLGAYYARDHILRTSLPMQDTFYKSQPRRPPLTFRGVPAAVRQGSRFPVFPLCFRRIFMDAKNFLVLHHFF